MPEPAVMHGVLRHLRRSERRRLYHLLGDRELLARFLADRDEAAFEEVVARHGPMVRAVCRRVLGPSADADDAFQAAFLVLLRRARSIRRADLLAGWLCAVAYRTARQALRRRSRLGARERALDGLPEPARPDDPPRDWLALFDAALQRLPAKYRDPIVLRELQGVSRRDASARLGLTEGTLSSRLGRARDLLRRKLGRHGFALGAGSALAPAVVPEALTASTVAASVHVSAASVSAVVLTEGVLAAMFASKLKAGALAGTAVLVLGVMVGVQVSGPASGSGGPPGKDGSPAKQARPEPAKGAPAKADLPPARIPAEHEPFQGAWVVERTEINGSQQGISIEHDWTFTGTALVTGGELKADAAEPVVLDAKAKPPTIDFTLTQFDPAGTGALVRSSYQGIYRFDGPKQLTICYRPKRDGFQRPTRFGTAANSGATLITLQRVEPEPKAPTEPSLDRSRLDPAVPERYSPKTPEPANPADPARDADLGKVVGAWELADVDGQTPEAAAGKLDTKGQPMGGERGKRRWEALRRLQLLPASGPMDLVNDVGGASYVAYVELDGTRNPKWFTLYATEIQRDAGATGLAKRNVRLCGIYKLDAEKLVVCLPEAEGSPLLRPTDYKGDGEGGLYLLTYQRAAKSWKPDAKPAPPPAPMNPIGGISIDAGLPFRPPGMDVEVPMIAPAGTSPPTRIPGGPVTPTAPIGPVGPGPGGPAPGGLPPVDAGPTGPLPAAPVPNDPVMPPARDTDTPPTDLDRLQGPWVMTQRDGKPPAAAEPAEDLEFLKDRVLAHGGVGRVRLDATKSPRQITITPGRGSPTTGIYKLEGDRLTIATSTTKSAKLVPIGFEPDEEAGVSVIVYERARPGMAPTAVSVPDRPTPGALVGGAVPTGAPTTAPPRDPFKEIEQLREQIQRLEKMLKERK